MSNMAGEQGRGRGERAGLTRAAILREAKAMAREPSSRALSMRALAARLGVDPMAVHYHFRGRERLLDAVGDDLLATLAPGHAEAWDDRLRALANSIHELVSEFYGVDWASRETRGTAGEERIVRQAVEALSVTELPERDAAAAARAFLALAIGTSSGADAGAQERSTAFRHATALIIDGLRMRALERGVAAGET